MTNTPPILPKDIPALQAMVLQRDAEILVRGLMIEKLQHQLAGHQRHRFEARSGTADQLALDIEGEAEKRSIQRIDFPTNEIAAAISVNTPIIFRSIARARFTPAMASTCRALR